MASHTNNANNKIFVPEHTVKRLVRDIISIHKHPLTSQGIYYQHDDENMLIGYAMIIGPKDTPYEHGFFFFKFQFPEDYPLSPPVVKYMTNDGKTRFHPNLYRNGKTCLSILNTWRGESWTSCQTIKSVLLTLISILDENPLLNEPGIRPMMKDVEPYKKFVEFKTMEHAHLSAMNSHNIPYEFVAFHPFIKKYCQENKTEILKKCSNLAKNKKESLRVAIYNMVGVISYKKLNKLFQTAYNDITQSECKVNKTIEKDNSVNNDIV